MDKLRHMNKWSSVPFGSLILGGTLGLVTAVGVLDIAFSQETAPVPAAESKNPEDELKKKNEKLYGNGAILPAKPQLEELLRRASLFASQKSYRNAIILWQKVLSEGNDILATRDNETFISLAEYVENSIRSLPPDGLEAYRAVADGEVEALLAQSDSLGRKNVIKKITTDYFLATKGDEAAFELAGELMDSYDFVGAARLLERIRSVYPNSNLPQLEIDKRLALCYSILGKAKQAKPFFDQLVAAGPRVSPEIVNQIDLLMKAKSGAIGASDFGNPRRFGSIEELSADLFKSDFVVAQEIQLPVEVPSLGNMNNGGMRRAGVPNNRAGQRDLYDAFVNNTDWHLTTSPITADGQIFLKSAKTIGSWNSTDPTNPVWVSAWDNAYRPDDRSISQINLERMYNIPFPSGQPRTEEEVYQYGDRIHQVVTVIDGVCYSIEGELRTRSVDSSNKQETIRPAAPVNYGTLAARSRANWLAAYDLKTGKKIWRRGASLPEDAAAAAAGEQPAAEADPNTPVSNDPAPPDPAAIQRAMEEGLKHDHADDQHAVQQPVAKGAVGKQVAANQPAANEEETSGGFMGPPVNAGNNILVPVTQGGSIWVLAIDKRDGEIVWKSYLCDDPSSSAHPWVPIDMAVEGSSAYLVCGTGVVFSIDVSSGRIEYARRYARSMIANPNNNAQFGNNIQQFVYTKGWKEDLVIPFREVLVVLASDCDELLAIDRLSGRTVWRAPRNPFQEEVDYFVGMHDGLLITASADTVICYDLKSQGRLEWQEKLPGKSRGRGFVAGEAVYIPVEDSIVKFAVKRVPGKAQKIAQVGLRTDRGEPVGNIITDGKKIWACGVGKAYLLANMHEELGNIQKKIEQGDERALATKLVILAGQSDWPAVEKEFAYAMANFPADKVNAEFVRRFIDDTKRFKNDPFRSLQLIAYVSSVTPPEKADSWKDNASLDASVLELVIVASKSGIARKDVPVLVEISKRTQSATLRNALGELVQSLVTAEDLEFIKNSMVNANASTQAVLLPALRRLDPPGYSAALESAVASTDPHLSIQALRGLFEVKPDFAVASALRLGESADAVVRRDSVAQLEEGLGVKQVFDALAPIENRKAQLEKLAGIVRERKEPLKSLDPKVTERQFGHLLVSFGQKGEVIDFGPDRTEAKKLTPTPRILICQGLPDGHRVVVLIDSVIEYDENWEKVNEFKLDGIPQDLERLPDGNFAVAFGQEIQIRNSKGEILSRMRCPEYVTSVSRMPNGKFLVTCQTQGLYAVSPGGTAPELVRSSVPLSSRTRVSAGVLVNSSPQNQAITIIRNGSAKSYYPKDISNIQDAILLPNGHYVVAHGQGVTEFDEKFEKVWEFTGTGAVRVSAY